MLFLGGRRGGEGRERKGRKKGRGLRISGKSDNISQKVYFNEHFWHNLTLLTANYEVLHQPKNGISCI